MTNLAQLLLIAVISTLTFLIALVAIQVFQILHEAKLTIKKFNSLLDNTKYLSESAAKPIQSMNQFFTEVKSMVENTQNEVLEATPDRVIARTEKPGESAKRFFHRAGAMLRPRN